MKKLLKEIGLYILIAVVLANLTVNIVQNNYKRQIDEYLYAIMDCIEGTQLSIGGVITLLENHQRLILKHCANLTLLNKITKPQKEPDFEKLLSTTVEITTMNGVGAGICIGEDTDYYYILTAQHVVTLRLGNIVSVRMRDKLIYAGKILKEDPDVDLALVRVKKWEDTHLLVVRLADAEPKVKDRVFVVGHPLGTHWTITEGIISNIDVKSYTLTTATVTYGNSGGALFNTDGNVIGICSGGYMYANNIPESNMGLFIRLSVIKEFLKVK